MVADNQDNTNEVLSAELRTLNAKLDLLEARSKQPQSKEEGAVGKITLLLGIPALLIIMMMNWGQAGLNFEEQKKTQIEAEKIRTEELKTRIELQSAIDELASKKYKSAEEYLVHVQSFIVG